MSGVPEGLRSLLNAGFRVYLNSAGEPAVGPSPVPPELLQAARVDRDSIKAWLVARRERMEMPFDAGGYAGLPEKAVDQAEAINDCLGVLDPVIRRGNVIRCVLMELPVPKRDVMFHELERLRWVSAESEGITGRCLFCGDVFTLWCDACNGRCCARCLRCMGECPVTSRENEQGAMFR